MSRNLKLTISYDGTRFVGWQRQAEGLSIQGLLEDTMARFEGGPVSLQGAGRTDAGVHALGQVASVRVTCAHSTEALGRGLNACLPPEIRVMDVEDVSADFHARFSARSKTYRYLIRNAPIVSPFERPYVWHVPEALELSAMQEAAGALVGIHDFSSFRSTGSAVTNAVRHVTRSEIGPFTGVLAPVGAPQGDETLLAYEVSATGFLRHMVRAVVGTLVETGRGKRTSAAMANLLSGGSRAEAGPTAPPRGLFLVRVDYD